MKYIDINLKRWVFVYILIATKNIAGEIEDYIDVETFFFMHSNFNIIMMQRPPKFINK